MLWFYLQIIFGNHTWRERARAHSSHGPKPISKLTSTKLQPAQIVPPHGSKPISKLTFKPFPGKKKKEKKKKKETGHHQRVRESHPPSERERHPLSEREMPVTWTWDQLHRHLGYAFHRWSTLFLSSSLCHPCHRSTLFLSTHVKQTTARRVTHLDLVASAARSCLRHL